MKYKVDLSRPDFIFCSVWLGTMILSFFIHTIYTVPFNAKVTSLVITNILSSIFVYHVLSSFYGMKSQEEIIFLNVQKIQVLKKWTYRLIVLWGVGFIINIIFSKGIPIYWSIIGDSRTYTSYGVPSFSGFLNAIRIFTSVSLMVLLVHKFKIKDLLILLFLILTSIMEISRGNFTFLLLTVVGVFFLYKKFDWKMIVLLLVGIGAFLVFFGFIGNIRGSSGNITSIIADKSLAKNLPGIFVWGIAYITSPFNNLNYAAEWINPNFLPQYTIMGMVPTIIREALLGPLNYPIQIADASLNATTFYSPLIADFGFGFTSLIVICMQIVITAIFMKAKRGSTFGALVYPILLSSLILSIFYMYLLTLLVVFYVGIAWIFSLIQKYALASDEV